MANEWQPNISKKIFITGGDDVQNNALATYLAANATQINVTTFDLTSLQTPLTPGLHHIKVKAKGSGYYTDSDFSSPALEYAVYEQLSAPATVTISSDTLSWAAVTNVSTYSVYDVVSGTPVLVDSGLSGTSLNLVGVSGLSLGQHTFKVKAVGSGYYTDSELSTASANYTKYQQLSAPQITISGTTLSWSTIADAASYTLYKTVGGTQGVAASGISSSATSYDFSSVISAAGVYDLQLKAIGSGYYTDSQLSNTIGYITPPTISLSGDTLSITPVPDAESYGIYVDGVKRDTVRIEYTITMTISQTDGIDVQYIIDNEQPQYFDQSQSPLVVTALHTLTLPGVSPAAYDQCDVSINDGAYFSLIEAPDYIINLDQNITVDFRLETD